VSRMFSVMRVDDNELERLWKWVVMA
jgi:hypothetical protein